MKYPSEIPPGSVISNLVELRDVFPTFADVGGIQIPSADLSFMQGQSMLCLIAPSAPHSVPCKDWRGFLDMELSTVYNATIHWNAITDGTYKYIFWAFDGTEQLFNLEIDRYEIHNLSDEPSHNVTLSQFRERMVAQFEAEGRGDAFVLNHTLQIRKKGLLYSPYFPTQLKF
jgi:arylsulfatase A-like enzyme